jgi:hypothetical protein
MSTRRIVTLLVAVLSLPGWGYSQSKSQDRFAITAEQVARTFSNKGIKTADLQVSLLAKVVASEADPVLDILSVEPRGQRQPLQGTEASYMVKLGCHQEGICLPFYAMVSKLEMATGNSGIASSESLLATKAALKPGGAVTMRAGAHATLVLDDGRAQIEIAVISLENGFAGHKIHVASPDHKQVYLAEVVSSTLLTRSF